MIAVYFVRERRYRLGGRVWYVVRPSKWSILLFTIVLLHIPTFSSLAYKCPNDKTLRHRKTIDQPPEQSPA